MSTNDRPRTALLVLAHPRRDSLTGQVADRARRRLEADGHTVDLLDLYAEGFDPRLPPEDEPDWGDRDKRYTPEVHAHMRRIDAADTIVVVFPVWWYAPPAIVKGWIDRVWNYGFAYGRSTPRLAGKRMIWIGLAGGSREELADVGVEEVFERMLLAGVSHYSGITDSAARVVYDTMAPNAGDAPSPERIAAVFAAADAALEEFLAAGRAEPATEPEPATATATATATA
ncbi:NAD(P)H oxidoreductase [Allostreptomyces psammosilenae]|uniref:Putative NADPH-quinone reductase n=1 Tax=Allostreptomyces psammosilenae TaxID=1892865 RepID=A0A853A6Q6_9ACTN|nr:NAD(P)H oxidoreductase [Allostreptomyces psammosilenae]NYI06361.1 putative NADPH-quinone reductase [Allostreptomyces psammosilenae]